MRGCCLNRKFAVIRNIRIVCIFVNTYFMTKFVNPGDIVAQLSLKKGQVVADFGCGAGFYSLAAAQFVADDGMVYAVDVMPDRLAVTQSSAQHAKLKNITVVQADLEQPLLGIESATCDVVVISNILHQVTAKEALLRNAYQVLKTGGQLLVVEWKRGFSPFGPAQDVRVSTDELTGMLQRGGFQFTKNLEADGYHYAVVFGK